MKPGHQVALIRLSANDRASFISLTIKMPHRGTTPVRRRKVSRRWLVSEHLPCAYCTKRNSAKQVKKFGWARNFNLFQGLQRGDGIGHANVSRQMVFSY